MMKKKGPVVLQVLCLGLGASCTADGRGSDQAGRTGIDTSMEAGAIEHSSADAAPDTAARADTRDAPVTGKDTATDLQTVDRRAERPPRSDATLPNGGLVLHWAFDEQSGTVAHDSSENHLDGTLKVVDYYGSVSTRFPSWVPGRKGNALEFNRFELAPDDRTKYQIGFVELANSEIKGLLDIGPDDDLTVSMWMNKEGDALDGGDHMAMLGKHDLNMKTDSRLTRPGFSVRLLHPVYDHSLSFEVSDQTSFLMQTEVIKPANSPDPRLVPTPGWHHVASVFDHRSLENCRWYIDGSEVAVRDLEYYVNASKQVDSRPATAPPSGSIASSGSFFVGIAPYKDHAPWESGPWNGMIDEVRIYKRALSSSEIQALYENP